MRKNPYTTFIDFNLPGSTFQFTRDAIQGLSYKRKANTGGLFTLMLIDHDGISLSKEFADFQIRTANMGGRVTIQYGVLETGDLSPVYQLNIDKIKSTYDQSGMAVLTVTGTAEVWSEVRNDPKTRFFGNAAKSVEMLDLPTTNVPVEDNPYLSSSTDGLFSGVPDTSATSLLNPNVETSNTQARNFKGYLISEIVELIAKDEGWKIKYIEPTIPIVDFYEDNKTLVHKEFRQNNISSIAFIKNMLQPYAISSKSGRGNYQLYLSSSISDGSEPELTFAPPTPSHNVLEKFMFTSNTTANAGKSEVLSFNVEMLLRTAKIELNTLESYDKVSNKQTNSIVSQNKSNDTRVITDPTAEKAMSSKATKILANSSMTTQEAEVVAENQSQIDAGVYKMEIVTTGSLSLDCGDTISFVAITGQNGGKNYVHPMSGSYQIVEIEDTISNGTLQTTMKFFSDNGGMGDLDTSAMTGSLSSVNTSGGALIAMAQATSRNETGTTDLIKGSANVSPDTSGSKSYGFMGLNDLYGSLSNFCNKYGAKFGLSFPKSGYSTEAFKQKWIQVAKTQGQTFVNAQMDYYKTSIYNPAERVLKTVSNVLSADVRALSYASDCVIQCGEGGASKMLKAVKFTGDVLVWLKACRDYHSSDSFLSVMFNKYLKGRPNDRQGLKNRVYQRYNQAISFKGISAIDQQQMQGTQVYQTSTEGNNTGAFKNQKVVYFTDSKYKTVTAPFWQKRTNNGATRYHKGIDIATPIGTPLYAIGDGVIVRNALDGSPATNKGGGYFVSLRLDNGIYALYMHMKTFSTIPVNTRVKAGQLLGYSGNSGHSTGPHLHFELRCQSGHVSQKSGYIDACLIFNLQHKGNYSASGF